VTVIYGHTYYRKADVKRLALDIGYRPDGLLRRPVSATRAVEVSF